jgi:hypothetical protein
MVDARVALTTKVKSSTAPFGITAVRDIGEHVSAFKRARRPFDQIELAVAWGRRLQGLGPADGLLTTRAAQANTIL